jgi:hypothetical protein
MTTLGEIPFDQLKPGMKFRHPEHDVQIILDLGLNKMGRMIWFHNCEIYNGQLPKLSTEDEGDIYEAIAHKTYPFGAEEWVFIGTIGEDELRDHQWRRLRVKCPHCSHMHEFIAKAPSYDRRRCIACGLEFDRQAEIIGRGKARDPEDD